MKLRLPIVTTPFGSLLTLSLLSMSLSCASLKRNQQGVALVEQEELSSEKVNEEIQKPYVSPLGEVPLDDNAKVQKWVKYFQGRGRRHMKVYLERSSRYLPMMKTVLRENGLPEDLVYVALIESGFSPRAHSSANAVGYWQFIRGTGKQYGLEIDRFVDERRDPVLSTRAASDYFKALYNLFGSWHLALAAYNCGENRVQRTVMRHYTRDFWALIKKRRSLPRETRNYVPKFIAAAKIVKDPAKYGFEDVQYQPALAYDTITIKSPISLKKFASGINASLDDLRLLNPKFRGDYVPIYRGTQLVLRVPSGQAGPAILAAANSKVDRVPKAAHRDFAYYRVRRGDSLSTIAHRKRTTVRKIRKMNRLKSRSFLRIGQRLKIPDNGAYHSPQRAQASSKRKSRRSASGTFHVVRRGENLSLISEKYKVSIRQLKKLNGIRRSSLIRIGQRLRIKATQEDSRKVRAPSSHRVARGEHLTSISKKYGVSVRDLIRWNAIKGQKILVGQKLRLKGKKKVHVVRRGETLTSIARRYAVPLSRILRVNDLSRRSVLMAGSRLSIPSASF